MLRTLLLVSFFVLAQAVLGEDRSDSEWPSLWDSGDPKLQQQLENILAELGFDRAVDEKRMSVTLVDISDLAHPRVAAVNEDTMMYAASVPKIAILLGAFVEIEEGEMTLDEETRESLTQMIRFSSNSEATRMLNRVGKQDLIDILVSKDLSLYDAKKSGGLWVGKEYGKSPAYQRDPLNNISHGATTMQIARVYYLMETGQVVGEQLNAEMKEILSEPGIEHKFVKGFAAYPDVKLYRKSGTWRQWHGDSVLVEAGDRRYILVGLVEDPAGDAWLSQLVKPVHELMVPKQ